MLKNQKGFTLIEIIAVLVILGILAAIAVPRFVNLQNDARRAAAQGIVAAAQSALSMGYAQELLNSTNAPTGPDQCSNNVVVDVPAGITTALSCTGTDWTVAASTITATYDGESVAGTWTRP